MSAGNAGATALQLLFAGVGNGAIYALVALGFNVIFKSTGALNFAQGEWVMLGGMIAAAAIASHAAIWVGCLVAVVIVAAVGLLSERLIVAPLKRPDPHADHASQYRLGDLHEERGDAGARQGPGRLSGVLW